MRGRIDVIGMVFGVGGLLMAAYVLSNGLFWFDFRWALGGTAILVGVVLLTNSLRRKQRSE
jgi:1,4-dihydroxy-2-naphthoate octaprenyltransferase